MNPTANPPATAGGTDSAATAIALIHADEVISTSAGAEGHNLQAD